MVKKRCENLSQKTILQMSDEGIDAPVQELHTEMQKKQISENNFWVMKPGETRSIPEGTK